MNRCLCCQKRVDADARHHAKCLKDLFGKARVPDITFSKADIQARASGIGGRMSATGAQMKVSVRLDAKEWALEVAGAEGTHVLKPEPDGFPGLPGNENLCMNIAAGLGMSVPPHGLFPMADGRLCYVVKRFDRLDDGTKLRGETMYRILGSEDEYKGSLERVGRAIRGRAANAGLDCVDFFERVLLCHLIGAGDMHLKKWALLRDEDDEWSLAPCYDLVSCAHYAPQEESALAVRGRKQGLTRSDFNALAEDLRIDPKAAENSFAKLRGAQDGIVELVRESEMSPERRKNMEEIILSRYNRLFGFRLAVL
ncbi:MAG: HipA domain-containing protein [Elusimicrobiota bacterium]